MLAIWLVASSSCVYQHAEALRQPPASPASFDWLRPGATPNRIGEYYFSSIPLGPNNTNDLFVVLTFSSGGTRAAALAYGVLDELRRIKVDCADPSHPETCSAKTLLDEVDVISSVSGGSLTAAYYARYGKDIFLPSSEFQERFLHTNAERELFGEAVYFPQNRLTFLGRPEIAANLWSSHLFHKSTFADLTKRPRPYLILNASDYLSESRFQFTQDQFDLLCDDLNSFPLSRAVAASSAFPGLLNSMTLNTHNEPHKCSVPRPEPQWVTSARLNQFENRPDYRDNRQVTRL